MLKQGSTLHKHVDAYSEFSKRLGSRFAAVWSIAKLTFNAARARLKGLSYTRISDVAIMPGLNVHGSDHITSSRIRMEHEKKWVSNF